MSGRVSAGRLESCAEVTNIHSRVSQLNWTLRNSNILLPSHQAKNVAGINGRTMCTAYTATHVTLRNIFMLTTYSVTPESDRYFDIFISGAADLYLKQYSNILTPISESLRYSSHYCIPDRLVIQTNLILRGDHDAHSLISLRHHDPRVDCRGLNYAWSLQGAENVLL